MPRSQHGESRRKSLTPRYAITEWPIFRDFQGQVSEAKFILASINFYSYQPLRDLVTAEHSSINKVGCALAKVKDQKI